MEEIEKEIDEIEIFKMCIMDMRVDILMRIMFFVMKVVFSEIIILLV